MLEGLVQWLTKATLQDVLLVSGGGGILATIVFWASKWAGRRRIQVRLLEEDQSLGKVVLHREVTNIGDTVTSLQPNVIVCSITPKHEPRTFVLAVQEVNRELPPQSPRRLTAAATADAVYLFCWFRSYKFRLTRGRGAILRFRNVPRQPMPLWRFWYEYLLFRWLHRVVKAA